MAQPTEEEKYLIHQLRERVFDVLRSEEQKSDPYLLRCIRGRDHDLYKAEEGLRKSLQWRIKSCADTILEKPLNPLMFHLFPYWAGGVDKQCHPVVEVPCGIWELSLLANENIPELSTDFEEHKIRFFETMLQEVKRINYCNPYRPWPITQFTVIADWKGYNPMNVVSTKIMQSQFDFSKKLEEHYPEILYKVYHINITPVFPLLLTMFKAICSPRTMATYQFYRTEDEWQPVLLEEIGVEQLGHMYGGVKIRMVGDKGFSYDNYNIQGAMSPTRNKNENEGGLQYNA